jgi:pimeloyl-ACP methyl ester carboxylesterase
MQPATALPRARRRWGRIVGRSFLGLVLLLAFVLACAAVYNHWAVQHYRAVYPPPGKLYRVDGFSMHLYCTGAGTPTLILEAGLGDDSRIWGKVQPELSKLTRVCSYDRAGLGWSGPRPGLRDSDSVADQLHGLLVAARISGPIVLMGHSIAGLHMRAYVSKYRQDIGGVVFVDGATPDEIQGMREVTAQFLRQLVWIKPLMTLGVARLAGRCGATPPSGMEAYAGWRTTHSLCATPVGPKVVTCDDSAR